MKKFAFLVILLLALTFSACTHTNQPPADTPDDDQVQDDDDTNTDNDSDTANSLVNYLSKPKTLDKSTILKNRKQEILNAYNKDFGSTTQPVTWDTIDYLFDFFETGTFKTGEYKDQKLVNLRLNCEGPCFRNDIHRFAWNPQADTLTHLTKNSEPIGEFTPSFVSPLLTKLDLETTLPELKAPETLTASNGEIYQLSQQDAIFADESYRSDDFKTVFTDPEYGKVYQTGALSDVQNGCVYIKSPDGSYHRYEYNPNFVEGFDYDTLPKLGVTWEGGNRTILAGNYQFAAGGCGITGACFRTFDFDASVLTLSGTSDKGHKFYELRNPQPTSVDPNSDMDTPEKTVALAYENYKTQAQYAQPPRTALSFEKWIKTHPILFFKDPLGNWSVLLNNDSRPIAECGKPVIYLYPERTTDVNVQVMIDKFTETIPAYGPQGWTVKAQPNGEIYNYADGRTYPYLFWEGYKKGGIEATEGFVVARKDLKNFFEDNLKKLGLNRSEREDFIEYWHTNMLASYKEPYFFISWVGTKDFNRVAPLKITPKPDTLIRIFMYQQPLSHPYKVKEQNLSAIPRRGFTVVEWGGTPKPWTE